MAVAILTQTKSFRLEVDLTEMEAALLKELVQNPTHQNELSVCKSLREVIFKALRDIDL